MERVGTLIHKLKEQLEQQEPSNKLLQTAQLLVAELQQKQTVNTNGKVAVTMPSVHQHIVQTEPVHQSGTAPVVIVPEVLAETPVKKEEAAQQIVTSPAPLTVPKEIYAIPEPVAQPVMAQPEPVAAMVTEPAPVIAVQQPEPVVAAIAEPQPIVAPEPLFVAEPVAVIPEPIKQEEISVAKIPEIKEEPVSTPAGGWMFDTVSSIPTLAHQEVKEVFELNTSIVADYAESHNDKLKEERVEVASKLQGAPIKDLRKAIGINDRYLFINELFRGDEAMYERSIKTINAFNIYPEAEYWIQREMKTKLGWIEDNDAVKLFDQLVKRRFS